MLLDLGFYLLLGSFVGILAGLLGVGGGLIMVPVLVIFFELQQISPDIIMHLALGTSLATILATSTSSVISHYKKNAVSLSQAAKLTPGIALGAWYGGILASNLESDILKPTFAIFELLVATYMLWGCSVASHRRQISLLNFSASGGFIGFVSSIVGIGGGSLTVPWLMWHGSSIHRAIATSAAVGFPIALAGSASYLYSGWHQPQLPEHAIGFIYLPALLGICLSSIVFAPIGANWAHKLEVKKLKKYFALLLIAMAIILFLK